MKFCAILLIGGSYFSALVHGWIAWKPYTVRAARTLSSGLRLSFFKDQLEKAFDNDDSWLSREEKRTGQIDEGFEDTEIGKVRLTPIQKMWKTKPLLQAADLSGKTFDLNFFLTGAPNKDPSNDLFGAKVNISSRDRKVGQAIPEEPTISNILLTFRDGNKCTCETTSSFVDVSSAGDWKLSTDGTQIRFRVQVTGFTRTIETKGTIQSIFWSNEPDKQIRTSTQYTIPQGWLYGEAVVSSTRPGSTAMKDGILKIEQSIGLLGAGKRMLPCGRFDARVVSPPIGSD